jgi:hypothetical protein
MPNTLLNQCERIIASSQFCHIFYFLLSHIFNINIINIIKFKNLKQKIKTNYFPFMILKQHNQFYDIMLFYNKIKINYFPFIILKQHRQFYDIMDQDLPMCLWAEAAMETVYVQNRLSHSALGFKTPEEMFTGKKPEVSHLKIFGCPVFVHIPKEKRNKLEPSGKKGIFVGYCEVSKAFRIYIPSHRHIEISRDVTFDEEAALKKSRRCQLEEVCEEEPVNPSTTESVREEPVREVVTSPDEEILEDHDKAEVQEPPQMTFSHKRKPAWARELIQDGEKYGVPEGTTR